jgi:aminopeptidase 2
VVKTDLESSPPSFSGESLTHLDITSDITTLTFNLHPTLSVTHLAISSSDLKTTSSLVLPLTALSVDKDQERGSVDLSSDGEWLGTTSPRETSTRPRERSQCEWSKWGGGGRVCRLMISSYALTQFEPTAARKAFP